MLFEILTTAQQCRDHIPVQIGILTIKHGQQMSIILGQITQQLDLMRVGLKIDSWRFGRLLRFGIPCSTVRSTRFIRQAIIF